MIISEIEEIPAGEKSYFRKELRRWPSEVQLMTLNQLKRIEGKDLFSLEKRGELTPYRGFSNPKMHEFRVTNNSNKEGSAIVSQGKTRNVQYRVCLTMIGNIAYIIHAYIHKGGKKSRKNEKDIKLAHERSKRALGSNSAINHR